MQNYKSLTGQVYALESTAFEYLLPVGSVPITATEATALLAPPAPTLAQNIAAQVIKIKADANRIVGDVIGNLGNEYQKAKTDADAFKAATYLGTVPSSVSSWATAKGWTAQAACDDILTAAANWLSAQDSIRANRLAKTEAAKGCLTQAALDTVSAQWSGYVNAMRTSLGI